MRLQIHPGVADLSAEVDSIDTESQRKNTWSNKLFSSRRREATRGIKIIVNYVKVSSVCSINFPPDIFHQIPKMARLAGVSKPRKKVAVRKDDGYQEATCFGHTCTATKLGKTRVLRVTREKY